MPRSGDVKVAGANQLNRLYFRKAYETGIHGWGVEKPSKYAVAYLRRVYRSRDQNSQVMLDLGVGEGRHSIAAAKIGFKVIGADYEPLALTRARKFIKKSGVGQNIRLLKADALQLPFRKESFDVVLDYGCLHHQRKPNWPRYLRNILKVLRPGGHLVLCTFTRNFELFGPEGLKTERKWHMSFGSYRRWFTRSDIRSLFGNFFEILEIRDDPRDGKGFLFALLRKKEAPGANAPLSRSDRRKK